MKRLWDAINFFAHWRAIDEEARREGGLQGAFDWRVLVILVAACVSLTLQEYVGDRNFYQDAFPYDRQHPDEYWELKGFGWWTAWRVGGYLLFPMLVVLCMPGERLRDYHLSPRGFIKHLWIYVVLFALVAPAVWAVSHWDSFQQTYPFYKRANRSSFDFWSWEAMYAMQFLSLEFFFRGFLLQGLRRCMGSNAIFVMIVPYCMIHYGKPMAETFGAIGAGIILGTLAMRTRSIWGGVVIHVGVATMMDALAVGYCPDNPKRPCVGH
jgi:membrane protease YdiL (CAAX protease family)